MFSVILTLGSALSISIIAAYFSIIGLSTIFPGSQTSVVIMGTALEIGKIVTVLWLHRNWKIGGKLIKTCLSFAVFVLMAITSLGIFGFLSKAHLEHQAQVTGEVTMIETLESKIEKERGLIKQYEELNAINQKKLISDGERSGSEVNSYNNEIELIIETAEKNIQIERDRLDALSQRIKDLDAILATIRNEGGFGKTKKLEEERERQAEEREDLKAQTAAYNKNIEKFRNESQDQIAEIRLRTERSRADGGGRASEIEEQIEIRSQKIRDSMDRVSDLQEEKFKYGESIRAVEAEIGPLRYVAYLVEDWGGSKMEADTAVRIIILIIMIVFDPLAILLIIASQSSIMKLDVKKSTTYQWLYARILRNKPLPEDKDPNRKTLME